MKSIPEILTRSQDAGKSRKSQTPVRALARAAVDAILEKKGYDILVMDMHEVSGVADIFVLCTGDAELQIKAIVDEVAAQLKETYSERPWHKEGYEHRQWVILDYVDLVIHAFNPERREFYSLERLWGDAPKEEVNVEGTSADVKLLQDDAGS